MKTVTAIPPYTHPGRQIFKIYAYNAWKELGGRVACGHYPHRLFHGFVYNLQLPHICERKNIAYLRFVQPISINFDTFPEYITYETIPFFWDVWPCFFEKTCNWLIKMNVKTAIFTSSQTAEKIQKRFPGMNILAITEGIDTGIYKKGISLKDRSIDLLEYGRPFDHIVQYELPKKYNHYNLRGQKNGKLIHTQTQLFESLADAKTVIMLPRCITNPEIAGDIETLTQRYWEAMLSRCVMVGHAPKELVDLIGYNPVIEIGYDNPNNQLLEIINKIENYQELVDRNRVTALKLGAWEYSINKVMVFLQECGYTV